MTMCLYYIDLAKDTEKYASVQDGDFPNAGAESSLCLVRLTKKRPHNIYSMLLYFTGHQSLFLSPTPLIKWVTGNVR